MPFPLSHGQDLRATEQKPIKLLCILVFTQCVVITSCCVDNPVLLAVGDTEVGVCGLRLWVLTI